MKITEHNYGMPREAYYGTIFSQSNGYMGVRASFVRKTEVLVSRGHLSEVNTRPLTRAPFDMSAIPKNFDIRP